MSKYNVQIDGEDFVAYNKDDVIGFLVQALMNRGIKTTVVFPDRSYIGND